MDSFSEFENNINRMPKNTRSSLIESQQANFTESANDDDLKLETERRRQCRQSEPQDIFDYSQIIPLARTYNSSGRPFNLSDFRNDMTSDYFADVNNSRTLKASDVSFPQRNTTSSLRPNGVMPYDESGRTFNLMEFQPSFSNSIQEQTIYLNDPSNQHLNASTNYQSRTYKGNINKVPCEFSKTPCQASQCQQHNYTASIDEVRNNGAQPTLALKHTANKNQLFEILVKDRNHPGVIVDAVNGLVDFNKIAFGAVFDCEDIPLEIDPESVPMSLLEAFSLRVDYEKDLQDDLEKRKLFCLSRPESSKTEVMQIANEEATYRNHRDDLKLASTIDIDMMIRASNCTQTPLTEAINCLLKAEKLNTFDRNVHLAEEAIRTAFDGEQELAALKSTCSFKLDLRKDKTKTNNTYQPLAIISYVGTTKPNYQ